MGSSTRGPAGPDTAASSAGSARLGLALTLVLAVPVAAFFLFAAFSPTSLAVPVTPGRSTTIWVVYGPAMILFAILLGGLYTLLANRAARARGAAARAAGGGLATLAMLAASARAASPAAAPTASSSPVGANVSAVTLFLLLVLLTLAITWWAARRTRSANDFYAAGGNLGAVQNGLAITGDVVSAGAFLGLAGLIYGAGFDGLLFAAASTLTIAIFYLIAQMVGAGQLIQLLFGLDYVYAEIAVGGLMVCYVMFGGMMATTWVQIVKAVLMLFTGTAIAVLAMNAFGFDYDAMLAQAVALHPRHEAMLAPTSFTRAPISTLSLGLAMFFGTCGLPHLIMRVFTVPDARTARASIFWGSVFIGYFFALITIIGVAGVARVMGNPAYVTTAGTLRGGSNMAAVHLAHALGGDLLLGFVSAVAFATILTVVAGLTLSGSAAVSHDLYASIVKRGRADERTEVRVSKAATLVLGLLAVVLGIAFRARISPISSGWSWASPPPPISRCWFWRSYWRGLTTWGAVLGGSTGLLASIVLTVLGPAVWVKTLGYAAPVFPLDPPMLVAMPLAFAVSTGVSLWTAAAAPPSTVPVSPSSSGA